MDGSSEVGSLAPKPVLMSVEQLREAIAKLLAHEADTHDSRTVAIHDFIDCFEGCANNTLLALRRIILRCYGNGHTDMNVRLEFDREAGKLSYDFSRVNHRGGVAYNRLVQYLSMMQTVLIAIQRFIDDGGKFLDPATNFLFMIDRFTTCVMCITKPTLYRIASSAGFSNQDLATIVDDALVQTALSSYRLFESIRESNLLDQFVGLMRQHVLPVVRTTGRPDFEGVVDFLLPTIEQDSYAVYAHSVNHFCLTAKLFSLQLNASISKFSTIYRAAGGKLRQPVAWGMTQLSS